MMCANFFRWIDYVLFGAIFTLFRANKVVQKKIDDCSTEKLSEGDHIEHSRDVLKAVALTTSIRLERIENKAIGTFLSAIAAMMCTFLAMTIAITVFGATSGLPSPGGTLSGNSSTLRFVAAALVLLAMLYLFGSGLLAMGAYKIGAVFRPELSDSAPVVEEQLEKRIILNCIEQNQRAATLRSNRLSASFACLRNGLLAVLLLGILVVLGGVL